MTILMLYLFNASHCSRSPKMYSAMAERQRYREVLYYTAGVLLATYLFIMGSGYYYFAQYTLSPGMHVVFSLALCL